MALDPVPWFVGGGAQHSPDVARMVAYAATGGAAGVLGNLDFRVTPLPVPGTSVRVAAGAGVVPNGYLAAPDFGKQSYIARAASVTDVPVTATGSGATRSDLVVLRMDDPQFGGQAPVSVPNGPYTRFAIISNVAPGTTEVPAGNAYPAIPLARIDLPASTGTILASHITDLRKMPSPRRTRDLYNTQPTATSSVTTTTTVDWTPQANRTIPIPAWATQAKIICTVSGVRLTGATIGFAATMLGTLAAGAIALQSDGAERATLVVADTFAIPAAMRGTSQLLKLRGNRTANTMLTDIYSSVLWDVEFLETPSAD